MTISLGGAVCGAVRMLNDDGQQDLDRVEPDSGRGVEVLIRVVDHVETPKHWHRVKHHMLKIDREIQKNQGQGDGEGEGKYRRG